MVRLISAAALTVLLVVSASSTAAAANCREHMKMGFDLHTSRHSSALAGNPDLLKSILYHYERALNLCPGLCAEEPGLCNNLGDVYMRLGNPDRAEHYFKRALKYRPRFGDALFELGRIQEERGLPGLALDYYLKALDANPDDQEAERNARRIAKDLGERSSKTRGYVKETRTRGGVFTKEELADGVIAQDAYARACKRFGFRNIVPVASGAHDAHSGTNGGGDGVVSAVALQNLYFESGSARLEAGSGPQLDEVARMLEDRPGMDLMIEGHTDDVPVSGRLKMPGGRTCFDNRCLSQERARSVKRALVKRGIDGRRLETAGYGPRRPLHPHDRARNRRVEIRLAN
jgi:flagellar motor protein MotB